MDQTLSALKDMSWTASLPFKGHFCLKTDVFNESLETDHDLFEFTTSIYKNSHHIIRFSPSVYPITGGFGKDSGGHTLITDLLQAAKSVGNCALVSNGVGRRVPTNVAETDVQAEQRILKCSNFRKYLSEQEGENSLTPNQGSGTDPYRVTSYTGDKKNARGCKSSGLSLKRRNSTLRHTSCTCRVKFTLRIDQNSFFLVCGIGENQHTAGHPPLHSNEIRNRKRFLDLSTLETVAAMSVANIQPAQAALFTKARTGQIFTRGQMAYVQGFTRMAKDFVPPPYDDATASESSPSENMLNYLQKSGASYVCLFNNGKTKELRGNSAKAARIEATPDDVSEELTSVSVIATDGTPPTDETPPFHEKSVRLEVSETREFKKYALESRRAVGAREEQDILIGCCWVLSEGRRLFHAFPEVLCVDGTHETNNESRPLVTLSVKDSNGKVTVVVRCFAPNERSWFFRWLFQEALPGLLGEESLHSVKLIMTDGDSQEMSQVDFAISTYFVNAVRSRCGWHLVDQGWRRNCRGLGYQKGKDAAARTQVRVIKTWIYSWMRRGILFKEEYEM